MDVKLLLLEGGRWGTLQSAANEDAAMFLWKCTCFIIYHIVPGSRPWAHIKRSCGLPVGGYTLSLLVHTFIVSCEFNIQYINCIHTCIYIYIYVCMYVSSSSCIFCCWCLLQVRCISTSQFDKQFQPRVRTATFIAAFQKLMFLCRVFQPSHHLRQLPRRQFSEAPAPEITAGTNRTIRRFQQWTHAYVVYHNHTLTQYI